VVEQLSEDGVRSKEVNLRVFRVIRERLRTVDWRLIARGRALGKGSADTQAQGGNGGKDHSLHRNAPDLSSGGMSGFDGLGNGQSLADENAAAQHQSYAEGA
jgi:hypothetical protein